MSYTRNFIAEINKTHNNLGNLVAVCRLVVEANKFALIVSPSGCGKSTAMSFIGKHTTGSWLPTSISIASLVNKVEKLTSFRSVIIVDDIATIQTSYSRQTSITTLSQLCYSHRVEPSMVGFDFCVEDFYGSALVGIQPIILRDLMIAPEWDASIQDKVLRYYHLYRPLNPQIGLPKIENIKGIGLDKVSEPDTSNKLFIELLTLGETQWSKSRSKEHIIDLLKALASLEQHINIQDADYLLLLELLKPMAFEALAVSKEELEGERIFDNNMLALLVEYYTYNEQFSLAQVAIDFKFGKTALSLSQCYRIMDRQNGLWKQISKSPTIYTASPELKKMLALLGLEQND